MNTEQEKVIMTNLEELEERIYDKQYEYVKEHFGEETADSANYGWGVDELENGFRVSTKVYGHGVLVSEAFLDDAEIPMDFTPS